MKEDTRRYRGNANCVTITDTIQTNKWEDTKNGPGKKHTHKHRQTKKSFINQAYEDTKNDSLSRRMKKQKVLY